MIPPAWVCKELAKFHPQARIGWDGERGKFGLIQLYHKKDTESTFREFWKRKGPIYSKAGRIEKDWDSVTRVPVYLIDLETEDVFSGHVLKLVKRWCRPIASRVHEDGVEKGREVERNVQEMGHELGDRIYRGGQSGKFSNGAPVVAKKFTKDGTINQRRLDQGMYRHSYEEAVLPPAPPGGWQKYIKKDQGDPDDLGSI